MNNKQAKEIVEDLSEDDKRDLLMYLAEWFDYKVTDSCGHHETYFLSMGETNENQTP